MKKWLVERFLPMWAKETVLAENRQLRRQNDLLEHRIREQECYIRGLHKGRNRIIIQTTGGTE